MKLEGALEQTRHLIEGTLAEVAQRADRYTAEIFEAQFCLYLADASLREPARRLILEEKLDAAAAWDRVVESVAKDYRSLDDE